ncbi:MAG: hypothetical protein L0Y44_03110 [Phycisphaerales bacterium]|nr:hypothetical protein [Phycisphaerales bacterium]MCI0629626.1 hypothetical protein [Phycisphaerales bacterium]
MNIIVLHDQVPDSARKDEADGLIQAQAVSDALHELGHQSQLLAASMDLGRLKRDLQRGKPDLVFNLVESLGGHGRLIHIVPALLEALRIPFTGASSESQFTTSNKLIAKRMMRTSYLPTAPWFTIEDVRDDLPALEGGGWGAGEAHRPGTRPIPLPGRYIIKSVWEHASVGLDEDSVVSADAPWQLREALENRLDQLGGDGFAEAYIDGREFNLALLSGEFGPEILPPAEILFDNYPRGKPRVVGYRAKWDEDSFEYHHTPQRHDFPDADSHLIERLSALAIDCWRLFHLHGYARVDFRVDESARSECGGRPWILEINANPCLSPDAGFAAALHHAGIPFSQAIDRIMSDALNRSVTSSASHCGQMFPESGPLP